MDETDDLFLLFQNTQERRSYLEEVKRSYLKGQSAIPFVQQNIELTDWQIRVYKNRPPDAIVIPNASRKDELESENQYLKYVLPVLNIPSDQYLISTTAVTNSSGSADYGYVHRVRDIGTPSAIDYGDKYIREYNQLQDVQQRPQQVRVLLEKLNNTNLIDRFDLAYKTYLSFRSGASDRVTIANKVRNLLHGLNGELLERARHFPKENMTWETMSSRLAIHSIGETERSTLYSQEKTYNSLKSRLSEVLKDREGGSITDLDSIWIEDFLPFIYSAWFNKVSIIVG